MKNHRINIRKYLISLSLFLLLGALSACDHPRIFAPQPQADFNPAGNEAAGQPMIHMNLSGGIAGVNQQLLVFENGFVQFFENYPTGGYLKDFLTAEALAQLKSAFIGNDFLHLQSRYATPEAADMFHYEITFRQNDQAQTVIADYDAAPQNLKKIIDLLNQIISTLKQNSPRLELILGQDTLKAGEQVTLKLRVSNPLDQALKLTFPSGKLFDFFALPASEKAVGTISPEARVWDWADDKAFTQSIVHKTLAAGAVVEYEVQWDGRSREGILLSGEFWIAAELESNPGGAAPWQKIFIQK